MTIGARLKLWRAHKNLKQDEASSLLGIPYSTYQKYEIDNKKPGADAMESFVRGGIDVNWLLTGPDEVHVESRSIDPTSGRFVNSTNLTVEFKLIDFYDAEASAGNGSLIDQEHKIGVMAFRKDWLTQKGLTANRCALLKARGDSMEPTIYDGDILLIDTNVPKIVDDSIYVLQYDHNLLVKRVQSTIPGGLVIISDNLRYPQQMIEPYYWEKVKIIGRVRWYGHEI